jgi:hypothetical protein
LIGTAAFNNNQPIINSAANVGAVTFGKRTNSNQQVTLTITTGKSLTVRSSLNVNTTATPTIAGTGTAALTMAPGSTVAINGTGTLTLNVAKVTLQSDATGDATIGAVTTTNLLGTSLANFTVERYLKGGTVTQRSYRLLSSPVSVATVTGKGKVYSINYIKNGSFLTGTDAVAGGFNNTNGGYNNPTLYLFRENFSGTSSSFTSGNYRGIKNINQTTAYNYLIDGDGAVPGATPYNIPIGNGFLFFFRGGTTTTTPFTPGTIPTPATLSTTGTLTIGQVPVQIWFTAANSQYLSYTSTTSVAGYNLVGNPYPSPIDWDSYQTISQTTGIYGSGITGAIAVLNPITKNFGSYQNGVASATFVSNVISSGQGFFVQANTTTARLIFNESAKTLVQNVGSQLLLSRSPVALAVAKPQYLRLELGNDSINNDQTAIRLINSSSSTNIESYTARHATGSGTVSLSSQSTNLDDLSINAVTFPNQKQTQAIKLNLNVTSNGTYQLKLIDIVSVPELYDIWLMDAYKKDSVNLRVNNIYSLDINKADSTTFGSKRLSLVIRQNVTFAYQLLDFAANKSQNNRNVEVTWKTANEENYTKFTIERSTDNSKTFDVLGIVKANSSGQYSFVDKNPDNTKNFYRLKQVDLNNTVTYSKVALVQFNDTPYKLRIFPNPAFSIINLRIKEDPGTKGNYNIRVMNSSGIIVKQFTTTQAEWQGNISNLHPGSYLIRVINTFTQNVVAENKFVKL